MSNEIKKSKKQTLKKLYTALLTHYGFQGWWPGDSDFEVAVGAILTQNTSWNNVEKAINNLKTEGLLNLQAMLLSRCYTFWCFLQAFAQANQKADQ